jgi:nucleoside-diphosphate-sugar epimerase
LVTGARGMLGCELARDLTSRPSRRELGRIAADADVNTLAPTLIGARRSAVRPLERHPPEAGVVHES